MCGQQFTPGELHLQQWANHDSQRADVHAQCITGGIGRDHELVPKVPADNEAKDAVIRLETACVVQPPPLKWFSSSTIHTTTTPRRPDDEDDRLFDREEALRHDDAIMDFQWFHTIPWTDIQDLRGATYVPPPARLRFALQQAQCHPARHHAPRPLFPYVRASLECTPPQQLAPPGLTSRERLRWQFRLRPAACRMRRCYYCPSTFKDQGRANRD